MKNSAYNVSNVFRDYKSEPAQPSSIYLYIYDHYKTKTQSDFAFLKQWQISFFVIFSVEVLRRQGSVWDFLGVR